VSTIREDGPSGRIAGTGATRGAVAVALIATMGWAQAAAAVTISITAERHGEIIEIHASALLKAEAATAWRVLTDYGRYPEFIPDLRVSRVVARRGPTVTVDQAGDARLWLLRMPLEITFEITESPLTACARAPWPAACERSKAAMC